MPITLDSYLKGKKLAKKVKKRRPKVLASGIDHTDTILDIEGKLHNIITGGAGIIGTAIPTVYGLLSEQGGYVTTVQDNPDYDFENPVEGEYSEQLIGDAGIIGDAERFINEENPFFISKWVGTAFLLAGNGLAAYNLRHAARECLTAEQIGDPKEIKNKRILLGVHALGVLAANSVTAFGGRESGIEISSPWASGKVYTISHLTTAIGGGAFGLAELGLLIRNLSMRGKRARKKIAALTTEIGTLYSDAKTEIGTEWDLDPAYSAKEQLAVGQLFTARFPELRLMAKDYFVKGSDLYTLVTTTDATKKAELITYFSNFFGDDLDETVTKGHIAAGIMTPGTIRGDTKITGGSEEDKIVEIITYSINETINEYHGVPGFERNGGRAAPIIDDIHPDITTLLGADLDGYKKFVLGMKKYLMGR